MIEKTTMNINIPKDLKKKLKIIALNEEVTLTEVVVTFLEYSLKEYSHNDKILK